MNTLREASFKGVQFHVEETGGQFGRRTVLHEYPFRDLPYGEDLGRAARRFDCTAFFLARRDFDAFVAVCESEGAGTLIHPFFGKAFVQLEDMASVRYPRAVNGRFSVEVSFVEAGINTEPDAQDDAAWQMDAAVDDALNVSANEFGRDWLGEIEGWLDIAQQCVDAVCDVIEGYLAPVEQAKARLQRMLSRNLLMRPLDLFFRMQALFGGITVGSWPYTVRVNLARRLVNAYPPQKLSRSVYGELRSQSGHLKTHIWTQPQLQVAFEMPQLPPSLATAIRRMAILEEVRGLAFMAYDSRTDLMAARRKALELLEAEITAADIALYPALENVRVKAVTAVENRLPTLKEIRVLHTQTTMPALVLAWQTNGSIDTYADVIARNKVRHPCFVPAGKVEIMRDE